MADFKKVKGGSLKLKGNKQSLFKADRKKAKKGSEGSSKSKSGSKEDKDAAERGGWWRITDEFDLKGGIDIAFEVGNYSRCYLAAMDNGKFTLGGPHREGEGPNPEEIFAVTRTPDETKFSMKTGYGKYIGVDTNGMLIATADAIGARERFQPVFQDNKSAIQAVVNPLFLSLRPDREGHIFIASKTATEDEMINIRTNAVKEGPVDYTPDADRLKAGECETSYVKMFQHSKVNLKGRHVAINVKDRTDIRRAQKEGDLHEALLVRRAKTKSDKYC